MQCTYKVMASGRQVKCNVPKTSWLVAVRCQSRAASPLATAFVIRNCSAVRGLKPTAPLFVIRRDLLLACRCTQRDFTVGAKPTNPLVKWLSAATGGFVEKVPPAAVEVCDIDTFLN